MLLTGMSPAYSEDRLELWSHPFHFTASKGVCLVGIKNVVITLPLSRDPRLPIAQRLVIKPSRYAMRPDFSTVFD
jgi:hypothetical protein